jgi:micrococcal nuclease
MKKRLIRGLILPLLLILGTYIGIISIDDLNPLAEQSDPYQVVRAVDGDTIIVDMDGANERIRLISIDTPESVHSDEKRNTEYGRIAAEFTANQLEGKTVTLEYDVEERDQYDRILAYVYLGGKMFNKTLLEEGLAKVTTYPPNVRYADSFVELQKQAQKDRKGIWADMAFEE